ncbi:hypothetical protein N8198_01005 [Gammaproteobacteria bacterium]|nr:hypothetical protein [Gammaproteobacteria bacterium]
MTLIAGVDIGNSTTEIVIAEGKIPIASERRATRGRKGSETSIRAAAALLRNIERRMEIEVDQVVVAPWHPVTTEVATFRDTPPDTGNIQIISCANHSVSGNSWAVGQPWNISIAPPQAGSVIAIVASGTGYRKAAEQINKAMEQGVDVSGVVVADDEAVLIASRLTNNLPVVDRADCQTALEANRLFIEVRPAGQCVNTATDVWALHSVLEAQEQDIESLNLVTRWVRDLSAVVIGLFDESLGKVPELAIPTATWSNGEEINLIDAIPILREQPVGSIHSLNFKQKTQTSDVWGVDIDSILADHGMHATGHLHRMALASLSAANTQPQDCLSDFFCSTGGGRQI